MAAAVFVVLAGYWFASKATKNLVPVSPFGPQLAFAGPDRLAFEEDSLPAPSMKSSLAAAAGTEVIERMMPVHAATLDDHLAQTTTEFATADPTEPEAPPPGYRWVTRRWKTLPGGARDYAALHGMKTFRWLVPVSSRLRSPRPDRQK